MALIKCVECSREISDKASACPGCGAPISISVGEQVQVPAKVEYIRESDSFKGTMPLLVKLALRAIQDLGWKLDQANESLGFVVFQTSVSWGSWSGVSCTLNIEEIESNTYRVSGTGKQNINGMQLVALNIGGEAQGKARKAIEKMKELATFREETTAKPGYEYCPKCQYLVPITAVMCPNCRVRVRSL